MGTAVTVAGSSYTVPAYQDQGWAQGAGNVSQLLIALAANIATSPTFMQLVSVTATPQTVANAKTYLVTTSTTAITLQLPTPAANLWFIVKDVSNNAFTKNITIARAAAENIDGLASNFVITTNNSAWIFMSNGTDWFSVGSANDLRLSDISNGQRYQVLMNGGVLSTQQL